MDGGWTLTELVQRAAGALAAADVRALNGRITEVPDARVIRWYTTTGLVDRPVMRGRVAYYGERHLMQLLAVKRLQAQGLTLAAIQQRLAGATDATLRTAAEGATQSDVTQSDVANERRVGAMIHLPTAPARPKTQARFWASVPAARVDGDRDSDNGRDGLLYGLRISDLTLLLRSPPADEDLPVIRAAARPLLELLASRNLISPGTESSPSPDDSPNADGKGGPA